MTERSAAQPFSSARPRQPPPSPEVLGAGEPLLLATTGRLATVIDELVVSGKARLAARPP
ncbi:hypothetical protein [Mycolicibacterium confluentis]|uniref:hypothetical protein n=1 Tax=Mycolicibacterium confluentis TaxID=28047 RepID=UPI0010555AD6|nr:hypothetical protein [Mycolicibacterium confluentis]